MGVSSQLSTTTTTTTTLQHSIMSKMMVAVASSSLLKVEQTKAASPYVNIGCQCSPLTFQDQYGAIQGNCKSVDREFLFLLCVIEFNASCAASQGEPGW